MKRSTIPLTMVMVAAMVVSTFQLFTLAVLAAEIIDEFGLTRGQLGWLGAANSGVGAVLAPKLGSITDRIGPKRSTGLVFLLSGIGLLLTASAGSYLVLIVASLVSGIPQGWSNPATNKLIATRLGPEERGLVIGFKQSGVQLSIFMAGLALPAIDTWVGWAVGLQWIGIGCLGVGVVAWWALGSEPETYTVRASHKSTKSERMPAFVYQVALYALLVGFAGGGVGRFLPLFANEKLGFSVSTAGFVVAFQGIVGIVARLAWGRATESRLPLRGSLLVMAFGGMSAIGILLVAETVGGWVLFPAVVIQAFTLSAWNVVANLAMIKSVPSSLSGRATGIMMFAFLAGLTISSPLVGWMVDRSGDYGLSWFMLLVACALGAVSVSRDIGGRSDAPG